MKKVSLPCLITKASDEDLFRKYSWLFLWVFFNLISFHVCSIKCLQVQLGISFGFVILFTFSRAALIHVFNNRWLIDISIISTLVLRLIMSFSETARRQAPMNLILLAVHAICEGFFTGITSSLSRVNEVFYAIGITFIVVFGLTIYAATTKEDFTT